MGATQSLKPFSVDSTGQKLKPLKEKSSYGVCTLRIDPILSPSRRTSDRDNLQTITPKGAIIHGTHCNPQQIQKALSSSGYPYHPPAEISLNDSRAHKMLVIYSNGWFAIPSPEVFSRHSGTCVILGDRNHTCAPYQIKLGDCFRLGSVGVVVSEIRPKGKPMQRLDSKVLQYLKDEALALETDDELAVLAADEVANAASFRIKAPKGDVGDATPRDDPDKCSFRGGIANGEKFICYMCYETHDTEADPLVAPCDCRGDTRYLHVQCLQKWFYSSHAGPQSQVIRTTGNGAPACKICGSAYKTAFRKADGRKASLLDVEGDRAFISLVVVTRHDTNVGLFNTKFRLNFGRIHDDNPADLANESNELTIGRSSQCNMILDYRTVSTIHAKISYDDGHFYMQDRRSSNGTMVYLQEPVQIKYNQNLRLRMGRTTVTLQAKRSMGASLRGFFGLGGGGNGVANSISPLSGGGGTHEPNQQSNSDLESVRFLSAPLTDRDVTIGAEEPDRGSVLVKRRSSGYLSPLELQSLMVAAATMEVSATPNPGPVVGVGFGSGQSPVGVPATNLLSLRRVSLGEGVFEEQLVLLGTGQDAGSQRRAFTTENQPFGNTSEDFGGGSPLLRPFSTADATTMNPSIDALGMTTLANTAANAGSRATGVPTVQPSLTNAQEQEIGGSELPYLFSQVISDLTGANCATGVIEVQPSAGVGDVSPHRSSVPIVPSLALQMDQSHLRSLSQGASLGAFSNTEEAGDDAGAGSSGSPSAVPSSTYVRAATMAAANGSQSGGDVVSGVDSSRLSASAMTASNDAFSIAPSVLSTMNSNLNTIAETSSKRSLNVPTVPASPMPRVTGPRASKMVESLSVDMNSVGSARNITSNPSGTANPQTSSTPASKPAVEIISGEDASPKFSHFGHVGESATAAEDSLAILSSEPPAKMFANPGSHGGSRPSSSSGSNFVGGGSNVAVRTGLLTPGTAAPSAFFREESLGNFEVGVSAASPERSPSAVAREAAAREETKPLTGDISSSAVGSFRRIASTATRPATAEISPRKPAATSTTRQITVDLESTLSPEEAAALENVGLKEPGEASSNGAGTQNPPPANVSRPPNNSQHQQQGQQGQQSGDGHGNNPTGNPK